MKTINWALVVIAGLIFSQSSSAQTAALAGTIIPQFARAITHYKEQNYAAAKREFYTLAQAGLGSAHFNLAVMALNGQGMTPNNGLALGFFNTAKELGADVPSALITQLESTVSDSDRATAAQIQESMGINGLASSLFDKYMECANLAEDALMARRMPDGYAAPQLISSTLSSPVPTNAALMKRAGVMVISALIDTQGKAHDPRLDAIVPQQRNEEFTAAAIDYLESASFSPGAFNGQSVPSRLVMHFSYSPINPKEKNIWSKEAIQSFQTAAAAGLPNGQYAVAYLSRLDNDAAELIGLSPREQAQALFAAALGGVPAAQREISGFFDKATCQDAVFMKDVWLRMAATGGDSQAQLALAKQFHADGDAASRAKDIHDLLAASASGTDAYTLKHAAFLLATSPVPGVFDPTLAHELALKLKATIKKAEGELYLTPSHGLGAGGMFDGHVAKFDSPDPEQDIVLAAAYGATGKFKQAIKTQQSAIAKAKKLGWETAELQSMLADFQNNKMPSYAGFYLSWSLEKLNAGSPVW